MPLRVIDQTQWCNRATGLRWARKHSGDLNGTCRQRPHITLENLEHPPQGHVRKKLDSGPTGEPPLILNG